MNMKRARRLHPGGQSFRSWARDVWKKFHEFSGDGNVTGKLGRVLGLPGAKAKTKGR